MNNRIPLRFAPHALQQARLTSLYRAIFCSVKSAVEETTRAPDLARQLYPQDKDVVLLLRSAVSPLKITDYPAPSLVNDLFAVIGQKAGAAAIVLSKGLTLSFAGVAQISIPTFLIDPAMAAFIGEGKPIPVKSLTATPTTLKPFKCAVICSFTAEMLSVTNIETVVEDALTRAIWLALDGAVFSNAAETADHPAGLLNGVTPVTPSAQTLAQDAMLEDVQKLSQAVAPVGGEIVFVASPTRAQTLRIRAGQSIQSYTVVSSPVLASDDLIAIAPDGIASAVGDVTIDSKRSASLLHMDSAPLPISTPPATFAATTYSTFQIDSSASKIRLTASWVKRDARSVAIRQGITAW